MKKAVLFVLFAFHLTVFVSANNWPRFLGPTGRSISDARDLPVKFSDANVEWKVALPEIGQSSPIIWEDDVFITSSKEDESERYVYCIDKKSGKIKWTYTVPNDRDERRHSLNTPATASCVTDGQVVVAFFGPAGLHCLDRQGKKLWSKDLGAFEGVFGTAASPIIYKDMVIQNCDAVGPSDLKAFDINTGKLVWETKRMDKPKGGWGTPFVIETSKREEMILNGEFGVQSYNPSNGDKYWFCTNFNGRGSPTPAYSDDTLYVVSGKPGDIYAVKTNGSGNVSDKMLWHTPRSRGRDLPSPMLMGEYLLVVNMKGALTCYQAKSGEVLWVEQMPRDDYIASPLIAQGMLYIIGESGRVSVIKPGPKYELVVESQLTPEDRKEVFRSSIGVSDQKFFIRSSKYLYCVKK